jgi:multidrug resistance efflux pump
MADGRRFSGFVGLVGVMLLLAPIAVTAWWLTRPASNQPPPGPPLDDLDVVCVGRVDAEGTVTALEPTQPGKVVRVAVSEGAAVTRGQEILAIDDTQFQLAVKEAKAAVRGAEIEAELAGVRARQFPKQIEIKDKQLDGLKADVEAGERKLAQMREQQSLTSAVSKADVAMAEASVQKLKLAVEAAKIEVDELRKVDPQLEVRAARVKLDTAKLSEDRTVSAAKDCVLRAPADGTILRLQVAVGGTIAPTAAGVPGAPPPAVVFAPAGPLVVRAEVEQSGLGRIKPGMKAVVKDDARSDSPAWTGRVGRIAGWVAPRRMILLEPGEMNDVRTTEVVIVLDQSPHPLWIGQRMQVRLVRGE